MKKLLRLCALCAIISLFAACDSSNNEVIIKKEVAPPADVPIAKKDANISIDVDNPPLPVQ